MRLPALGAFLGFTDDDVVAVGARNRPADQQDVVGLADLDDFEILHGAADLAEVAWHSHAAHDCAGKQTLADGTGPAVPALGAVRRITAAKGVTRNDALKAASLGHTDGVHKVAWRKEGRAAEFFDVTQQRFGKAVFLLVVETQLDGFVAVGLLGFALQNAVGAGEDD